MPKSKLLAGASAVVFALGLSACGGGSSGGGGITISPPPAGGGGTPTPSPSPTPSPTPTPTPPPTGVNDDLLPTLASETFINKAETGSVTFQKSDGSRSGSTSASTATISYNAANQSYTLTVGSRSRTFAPANIDNSLSTAQQAVYLITNGTTTDTLAVSRPGTSGPLTYRYVGSAFWQRTVDSTSSIGGTLDALVYGVPTLANDVPTTGTAFYSFDLVGGGSYADNVFGLGGNGNAVVNFADGEMLFNGSALAVDEAANRYGTPFTGSAQIASGTNGFSGQFGIGAFGFGSMPDPLGFSGTLQGLFFGPDAAELGAVLRSTSSSTGLDMMVGALLGRKGVEGQNTSFADALNLQADSFLAQAKSVTFDSNGQTGPATVTSTSDLDLPVLLVPSGQQFTYPSYTFITPDGQQRVGALPSQNGVANTSSVDYAGLSNLQGTDGWLQYEYSDYANLGRLVSYSNEIYTFTDFLFGFETPLANLPSGNAAFRIDVNSLDALYFGPSLAPVTMGGQGRIVADFAAGTLDLDAILFDGGGTSSSGFNNAGLTGSAAIASGTSKFTGAISVSGVSQLTGTWEGGIFGPTGAEIAAIFSASGTGGQLLTGAFFADRDDSLLVSVPPLEDLPGPTDMPGYYGLNNQYNLGDYTYADRDVFTISYDPTTGNFTIPTDVHSDTGNDVSFTAADVLPAQSDATWTFYRSASGDQDLRVLAAGAGAPIELTYASFAWMTTRRPTFNGTLNNDYFFAYGSRTPEDRLPLTGSASYTGIALGNGYVKGMGNNIDIDGTVTFDFDFGTNAVSGTFDLIARDPNGLGNDLALGAITGTSDTLRANFYDDYIGFSPDFVDNDLFFAGQFFGPNAEETAGMWTWDKGAFGNPDLGLAGVFGAKKDP